MRMIDADALIENFGKLTVELWLDSVEEAEIVSLIGNSPTIEPKRGEWIKDKSSPIAYRCTACNTLQHWSAIQDGRYHFCPNCGAQMKGADDETD